MDITIGSYKLRLEYAIIIVFLIVVIFSHSMRASSYSGLLEGFEVKKDSKGKIRVMVNIFIFFNFIFNCP